MGRITCGIDHSRLGLCCVTMNRFPANTCGKYSLRFSSSNFVSGSQ
jgi:hypothetical protein